MYLFTMIDRNLNNAIFNRRVFLHPELTIQSKGRPSCAISRQVDDCAGNDDDRVKEINTTNNLQYHKVLLCNLNYIIIYTVRRSLLVTSGVSKRHISVLYRTNRKRPEARTMSS